MINKLKFTTWRVTRLSDGYSQIVSYKESKKFYGRDGYFVEIVTDGETPSPTYTKKAQANPITLVGLANPQENPPRSVNANIEGVVYNRCIEIRAEKTGYKKGFYKHPFSKGSQVCIYALDNGDLLVHSKAGVKLWQPD